MTSYDLKSYDYSNESVLYVLFVHDRMMSLDVMTKYGMCVASLNKVSEHVRACSEFRVKRENSEDKTAQVTKVEVYKVQVLILFLFGISQ